MAFWQGLELPHHFLIICISKQTLTILFCLPTCFHLKQGIILKWKHFARRGCFEYHFLQVNCSNEFSPYNKLKTFQLYHFGSFYFSPSEKWNIFQLINTHTLYERWNSSTGDIFILEKLYFHTTEIIFSLWSKYCIFVMPAEINLCLCCGNFKFRLCILIYFQNYYFLLNKENFL